MTKFQFLGTAEGVSIYDILDFVFFGFLFFVVVDVFFCFVLFCFAFFFFLFCLQWNVSLSPRRIFPS